MAIINFCLDISNIKNEGITINKVTFYQNENALLPSIARKMISKKDILKAQLKSLNPESEETKDLQVKYDAIKAVVNSLFGVCGLKIFRLFDYRVAASITFLIRDLLHYVENKLVEKGMKVIYMDTDSVFIEAPENPKDLCNDLIKQWAKEKYNKDRIDIAFDLEGQFGKLFIIALCHYKGYLSTPKGVKEEIKGIEARRKDSSTFIRDFQTKLIEKIMNEDPKEEIIKWINVEKLRIRTLPLIDVGFPCRITKDAETYKSIPVFLRALQYTQELIPTFQKHPGDSFYWIPVIPFGKSTRKSSRNKTDKETGEKSIQSSEKEVNKDVLCYDEDISIHITDVNWDKVINKSIVDKVEHIFEALKWDMSEIKEVKVKKERKSKNA
jgi:DNA polymerase I